MKTKLNTSEHFKQKTQFDEILVNDNLRRVVMNRKRIVDDAKDFLIGKKTKGVQDLVKKFDSAKIRLGYKPETTLNFVAEKIVNGDDGFIGTFMVQPKRQHGKSVGAEFLTVDYIQSNQFNNFVGVKIERLPNQGPNSERICKGQLVKGIDKSEETTKSLDGKITLQNKPEIEIRTIHKTTTSLLSETNDGGGAQSNQLELSEKDVDKINFDSIHNQNLYIIFILDGKFYKNNNYVLGLIDKYKTNKNVYFTTSDGIKEVIGTILYN